MEQGRGLVTQAEGVMWGPGPRGRLGSALPCQTLVLRLLDKPRDRTHAIV